MKHTYFYDGYEAFLICVKLAEIAALICPFLCVHFITCLIIESLSCGA